MRTGHASHALHDQICWDCMTKFCAMRYIFFNLMRKWCRFGMKLEKFEADPTRRPFFVENTLVLVSKVKIRRLISGDEVFFFREH